MATIVSIKQKIEQLDAGSFQVLCDAYLSREGYPNPVSLGTKAGTQKTTQGTPDTYFCLANGKYVLAEYTTQRPGLAGKIRSDLEKCFDSQLSGINNDDITEIIYCHTSSGIDAGADKSLKRYCQDKGVQLTMIGIDKLAEDISRKYPILAKEHLGLSVDTEQIQDPLDFVRQYDTSALAAPLNTNFLFRENEIVRLQKAFDENNVVILSGAAGTGKTRLALEFAERLVGYNIDISVFKSCAYKLHEMELVDICRDKAVAISDQCFANYILKHVFVDKKTISLAQMLDTCFQTYRKRTIQTVNTLLGVFQSQDVYDFTIHEIKVVWKKRKSESFNKYWDWVKAFYQVDQGIYCV